MERKPSSPGSPYRTRPVKYERELVFRDRHFPLDVFVLDEHPDYPLHIHDFTVIVIVLRGRGINIIGQEEFPVKAGDVFVHHGMRSHGYRATELISLPESLRKVPVS